jgi:hypothetical protein
MPRGEEAAIADSLRRCRPLGWPSADAYTPLPCGGLHLHPPLGTFQFTQLKSSRGRRAISLPPLAIDALRRWRRERTERRLVVGHTLHDLDLVLGNAIGRPIRSDSTSTEFRGLR